MSWPVWVNGSAQGRIDAADRGLAYGDGLFETLRVEQGRAVLADGHFQRLAASAEALAIPLALDALRDDFVRFLALCPPRCVAKIILTRGVSERGYWPDPKAQPTLIFTAHPLLDQPTAWAEQGIQAAVCTQRLAVQSLLAGHKHLNRLEQVLLRRELAGLSAQEALVCSQSGDVVEGVFSNVFLVRKGGLLTPALTEAGVCGVLRGALLARARQLGLSVQEARLQLADFLAADEVFFSNSVSGIWPVARLQDRQWQPGPLTRELQAFWQEQLA